MYTRTKYMSMKRCTSMQVSWVLNKYNIINYTIMLRKCLYARLVSPRKKLRSRRGQN